MPDPTDNENAQLEVKLVAARRQWQTVKTLFEHHLGPWFGAGWVQRSMREGLGHTLDLLEQELRATRKAYENYAVYVNASYRDQTQVVRGEVFDLHERLRRAQRVIRHAQALRHQAVKAQAKLTIYDGLVVQRAREVQLNDHARGKVKDARSLILKLREQWAEVEERAQYLYLNNMIYAEERAIQELQPDDLRANARNLDTAKSVRESREYEQARKAQHEAEEPLRRERERAEKRARDAAQLGNEGDRIVNSPGWQRIVRWYERGGFSRA